MFANCHTLRFPGAGRRARKLQHQEKHASKIGSTTGRGRVFPVLLLAVVTAAALALATAPEADAAQTVELPLPSVLVSSAEADDTPALTERVQVKFNEGTGIRLRDGQFVSETGADVDPLNAVLSRFQNVHAERLFTRPESVLAREEKELEAPSDTRLDNLNLYFRLDAQSEGDAAALVKALNTLELVEIAYA